MSRRDVVRLIGQRASPGCRQRSDGGSNHSVHLSKDTAAAARSAPSSAAHQSVWPVRSADSCEARAPSRTQLEHAGRIGGGSSDRDDCGRRTVIGVQERTRCRVLTVRSGGRARRIREVTRQVRRRVGRGPQCLSRARRVQRCRRSCGAGGPPSERSLSLGCTAHGARAGLRMNRLAIFHPTNWKGNERRIGATSRRTHADAEAGRSTTSCRGRRAATLVQRSSNAPAEDRNRRSS